MNRMTTFNGVIELPVGRYDAVVTSSEIPRTLPFGQKYFGPNRYLRVGQKQSNLRQTLVDKKTRRSSKGSYTVEIRRIVFRLDMIKSTLSGTVNSSVSTIMSGFSGSS